MTAVVYQLRDYQSAKDRARIAKLAREIMDQIDVGPCETIPHHGSDGMMYESSLGYVAPEKDPA